MITNTQSSEKDTFFAHRRMTQVAGYIHYVINIISSYLQITRQAASLLTLFWETVLWNKKM